jgi:hypothetical protein
MGCAEANPFKPSSILASSNNIAKYAFTSERILFLLAGTYSAKGFWFLVTDSPYEEKI